MTAAAVQEARRKALHRVGASPPLTSRSPPCGTYPYLTLIVCSEPFGTRQEGAFRIK